MSGFATIKTYKKIYRESIKISGAVDKIQSWISKRLPLVEQLNERVTDLVLHNEWVFRDTTNEVSFRSDKIFIGSGMTIL